MTRAAIVFTAVTLAIAGCGGRALTPTSLHLYAPFAAPGTLAKGVKIFKSLRGSCWSGSNPDVRWDAWRCSSRNAILDPCFAGNYVDRYVICPSLPTSGRAFKLILTRALPYKNGNPQTFGAASPTKHSPWAIRLVSHVWCARSQGAAPQVAGLFISYFCTNGSALLGEVRRTNPQWTIFEAPRSGTDATLVAISEAWW